MTPERASAWLVALAFVPGLAAGQESDDLAKGHHLATLVCSACHIAAPFMLAPNGMFRRFVLGLDPRSSFSFDVAAVLGSFGSP